MVAVNASGRAAGAIRFDDALRDSVSEVTHIKAYLTFKSSLVGTFCSIQKHDYHEFVFSFFQLSGVALVTTGAWTLMFENEYSVLLGSSWFLIIVGLMIGTGGLIMIVCLCGCYGVVKEHRYFLVSVCKHKFIIA